MSRKLDDLTKQDWDSLFPIELVKHRLEWKVRFEKERQLIDEKIGDRLVAIEHVGSTAIPGIKAKPYIDISIEIPKESLFNKEIIQALEGLDYHYFKQSGKGADYMVFVKGYNFNGLKEQVFHIHMCPCGHEMLEQVLFRDYLIAHPTRAREYEHLKVKLDSQFKNDRTGYRMAKDQFITDTMKRMEEKSGGGR